MTFWQAFRELFVYAVIRFPDRAAFPERSCHCPDRHYWM